MVVLMRLILSSGKQILEVDNGFGIAEGCRVGVVFCMNPTVVEVAVELTLEVESFDAVVQWVDILGRKIPEELDGRNGGRSSCKFRLVVHLEMIS